MNGGPLSSFIDSVYHRTPVLSPWLRHVGYGGAESCDTIDFGTGPEPKTMIDADGFRPNVGIVLARHDGRVFWARRAGQDGWQFPQGGMNSDETPEEAMYRELAEETGLQPEHVDVLGATPGWLRYRLPRNMRRRNQRPVCIGQKQVWFLLHFLGDLCLDLIERQGPASSIKHPYNGPPCIGRNGS